MNARTPAITIIWSRDSNKFALVRRDSRKVADLWVINALAQPRPTLETYRYAMPGEANIPQSEIHVFDRTSKQRVTIKADRFTDQTRADRHHAATGQHPARSAPADRGRSGSATRPPSCTSRASAATSTGSTSRSPTRPPAT